MHLYEGWQQVKVLEPEEIESDDYIIEMTLSYFSTIHEGFKKNEGICSNKKSIYVKSGSK